MARWETARTWASVALLVLMAIAVGCSDGETGESQTGSGTQPAVEQEAQQAAEESPVAEPAGDPEADPQEPAAPGAAKRPSVADAEKHVLSIAREAYAGIPTESAKVVGMGLDSSGVWWIQAWTDAGPQYEGEQWFVTFDGENWAYYDSGTGMERTDYPADIAWEDVP